MPHQPTAFRPPHRISHFVSTTLHKKYRIDFPSIDKNHHIGLGGKKYDYKASAERDLSALRDAAGCSRK